MKKIAFKLVSIRKDGSIGPLFMNKRLRLPFDEWMVAEDHRKKGFAHRVGWHVTAKRHAPHLSKKNRVWIKVEIADFMEVPRPESQGGLWYLAQKMKVLKICKGENNNG